MQAGEPVIGDDVGELVEPGATLSTEGVDPGPDHPLAVVRKPKPDLVVGAHAPRRTGQIDLHSRGSSEVFSGLESRRHLFHGLEIEKNVGIHVEPREGSRGPVPESQGMRLGGNLRLDHTDGRAEAPRDLRGSVATAVAYHDNLELARAATRGQSLQQATNCGLLVVGGNYQRSHCSQPPFWGAQGRRLEVTRGCRSLYDRVHRPPRGQEREPV